MTTIDITTSKATDRKTLKREIVRLIDRDHTILAAFVPGSLSVLHNEGYTLDVSEHVEVTRAHCRDLARTLQLACGTTAIECTVPE